MGWFAALAPIIASMAGGAASSAIKNSSAQGGEQGYDMPYMDPGPWDAQNQQLTGQLGQNMALNAMQGRLSPGQEIMLDKIKKYQLQQSKEQMFGTAGRRGGSIMDMVDSRSSRSGVGPKAFMAQGSKALQDYAGRQSQIQNYIDSLKQSGLMNNEKTSANIMQSMPRSANIPYQGQVVPMNTPGQPGMDTGLGNIDYQSLFKNFNQEAPQVMPQTQYNVPTDPYQSIVGSQPGKYDYMY